MFERPENRNPNQKGFEYNGETHTLAEWSRLYGMNYHCFYARWQKCKQPEYLFKGYTRQKMTHADVIRNMTDEELADILFDDCTIKMGLETCKYLDCDGHDCKKCVFEWLQAEVKEGGEK